MSQEITAEFLEEKRKAFPNFYFISNEALVKVLESGNDFASLRNFLGQMFAGIADLQTNEAKQVEGIVSPDGIALKLKAPVATEGRDVVDWLKEVYAASKAAVKDELQRAIAERPESVTLDWISGNLP
jgi:dynein heavy chain